MDFFIIAKQFKAKTYTECIAAVQGARMLLHKDLTIGNEKIRAYPPKKNTPDAIVKTSINFREAAKKAYLSLDESKKEFLASVLEDFMKNGLSMPVLGQLENASDEEKTEIEGLIGERI